MMKKIFALLCAAVLVLSCETSVFAEDVSASGTIETIMNVGTTQAFTDEPVSTDDLKIILETGLAAASAINQQPWYFVAVTNQELMSEITGSASASAFPSGAMPGAGFGTGEGAPNFNGGPGQGMPGTGSGFGPGEGAPNFSGGFGNPGQGMPGSGDGFNPGEGFPNPNGSSSSGESSSSSPLLGGGAKAGLGDSPAAIIIYRNDSTSSPNPDFDCGLAAQNMVIAAASLGYGVKIVSSPTMTLNGANHDALCEKMGVDPSMQAVAVLLIGHTDTDAITSATTRETLENKASIIE